MQADQGGVERQRRVHGRLGLVMTSDGGQRDAAAIVGQGQVRIQGQGPIKGGERSVLVAALVGVDADAQGDIGVCGLHSGGAVQPAERVDRPAPLLLQHAHQLQALGLIGNLAQHLAKQRFGLVQRASLQAGDRLSIGLDKLGGQRHSLAMPSRSLRSNSAQAAVRR
jgi:hypothetical protein